MRNLAAKAQSERKRSFEMLRQFVRRYRAQILRDAIDDERGRRVSERGAKEPEKMRLGDQHDSLHACARPAGIENLGEVLGEAHRGALMW